MTVITATSALLVMMTNATGAIRGVVTSVMAVVAVVVVKGGMSMAGVGTVEAAARTAMVGVAVGAEGVGNDVVHQEHMVKTVAVGDAAAAAVAFVVITRVGVGANGKGRSWKTMVLFLSFLFVFPLFLAVPFHDLAALFLSLLASAPPLPHLFPPSFLFVLSPIAFSRSHCLVSVLAFPSFSILSLLRSFISHSRVFSPFSRVLLLVSVLPLAHPGEDYWNMRRLKREELWKLDSRGIWADSPPPHDDTESEPSEGAVLVKIPA